MGMSPAEPDPTVRHTHANGGAESRLVERGPDAHVRIHDLADAHEAVGQNVPLEAALRVGSGVLPATTSTAACDLRARRLPTVLTRLQHRQQPSLGERGLGLQDLGSNLLAG